MAGQRLRHAVAAGLGSAAAALAAAYAAALAAAHAAAAAVEGGVAAFSAALAAGCRRLLGRHVADPDEAFCYASLGRVSRSFAVVIGRLPPDLRRHVCVYYLVLRALDTVEDDMTLPEDVKRGLLLGFADRLAGRPAPLPGHGETEADRELLRNFDRVLRVHARLPRAARRVIRATTAEMAGGMVEFLGRHEIETMRAYERYCYFVAGVVGVGLTELFAPRQPRAWRAAPDLRALSVEMGLLLQKTNITRDLAEDLQAGRSFWPREVWGQEVDGPAGLAADVQAGVRALNRMVTDALRHLPACVAYLSRLTDREVFRFCALPQLMAVATLAELYGNPRVLAGPVKIRRTKAAGLLARADQMAGVCHSLAAELSGLRGAVRASDPSAAATHAAIDAGLAALGGSGSPPAGR